MLEHRHGGISDHGADEPFAAARDDQIDIIIHFEHQFYRFMPLPRNDLHHTVRKSAGYCRLIQNSGDRHIGVESLFTAAQNHRIARFYTDTCGIGGHIGAGFINDADDTERNRYFGDFKPVGTDGSGKDFSHRIKLFCHGTHSVSHAGNAGIIEGETVDHRRRKSVFCGKVQIFFIGTLNRCCILFNSFSHFKKAKLLGFIGKYRQRGGGAFGFFAHIVQNDLHFFNGHNDNSCENSILT